MTELRKEKRILEVLGQVDEQYIEEAAPGQGTEKPHRAKRYSLLKWGAVAACACAAVCGIVLLHRRDTVRTWPILEVTGGPSTSEKELFIVPRWEELPVCRQYSRVAFAASAGQEPAEYNSSGEEVPSWRIGEELGEVIAEGWDSYADRTGEDAKRQKPAKVRSITKVSNECAIAVQYEGTDEWYAFTNSHYRPQTLGQFIEDLNLREELSFGTVYYSYWKSSGEYATVRFDKVSPEVIWESLLSETGAENEADGQPGGEPYEILGISVDIPLLGYKNISLSVREEGYITTNILDTGKRFLIGTENTQAFVDYVLDECEGYELVYVDSEEKPEGSADKEKAEPTNTPVPVRPE